MQLKKITLNNIRSYKSQEVIFPENSTLLSGDIGSGKTSVLLGIEFGFFGLQPGQKGSSLLKNGADFGSVILEFEIDGNNVIVERTLKRGKSISQDSCSISVNGNKKETSVMELKSAILEMLNYPKEFSKKQNLLYKFTVYTPQEEMKQIVMQDSETRTNTLRHIFGIDKYKVIIENSSILLGKIREEKRINESAIASLEEDRRDLASKENELLGKNLDFAVTEKELFLKKGEVEKMREQQNKLSEKLEKKSRILQETEKMQIVLGNKNESLASNLKTILQIENQIKEFENLKFEERNLFLAGENLKSKKKEKEKISEDSIGIISRINSCNSKIKECELLIDKIKRMETCPTCMQEVNSGYKKNIFEKANSEIAKNNEELILMENEKKFYSEKLSKINEEIQDLENEFQRLNILKIKILGFEEKQERLSEINGKNCELKKEISVLNEKINLQKVSLVEFNGIDEEHEKVKKEFDESLRREKIVEIKFAELKKEMEFYSMQMEKLREKIKNMEKVGKKIKHLAELENWLSQRFIPLVSFIEKNVMLKLKAEFSKIFSEWFSMLVSENFNTSLDDDFAPLIKQQDYELDYSYLSGGERTAVALAYRLALNQIINSLLSKIKTKDVIILDEPTDGFSSQQLEKMRDVLYQLNVKQLIIVSHEQKMENFVDNVIKFKKVNGVSVMED
ncbi:MAG TPA: AAA family ATPase [Candidatus Nanoarchaeia archaeon]|nr:AAA family ATPase [Candidatus Nanoarchaeia archaeon]